MASGSMASSPIPGMQIVDEFEKAFMDMFAILLNSDGESQDPDEARTSADFAFQRLKDVAVQMDIFFLQRRFLASSQHPDHFLAEDVQELQAELKRKDELLEKYYAKLDSWRKMLNEVAETSGFPVSQFSSMVQDPSLYAPPPNQMPSASMPGPSNHPVHMMQNPNMASMQPIPMPGPSSMHPQYLGNSSPVPPPPPPPAASLHGPLGYMERSMSNINMPSGSM